MPKLRPIHGFGLCVIGSAAVAGYATLAEDPEGRGLVRAAERPPPSSSVLENSEEYGALTAAERAGDLRQRIRASAHSFVEDQGEDFTPRTVELSEEEQEYLSDLRRRTDPVYFGLAPTVLESMWQEAEPDTEWSIRVEHHVAVMNDELDTAEFAFNVVGCRGALCKVQIRIADIGRASGQPLKCRINTRLPIVLPSGPCRRIVKGWLKLPTGAARVAGIPIRR